MRALKDVFYLTFLFKKIEKTAFNVLSLWNIEIIFSCITFQKQSKISLKIILLKCRKKTVYYMRLTKKLLIAHILIISQKKSKSILINKTNNYTDSKKGLKFIELKKKDKTKNVSYDMNLCYSSRKGPIRIWG
ncbi:hypothetical protein RFI_12566 [Reticulomyxa filosa]|uniref:Uncharacterized protein n=1 Tax=Reticulomyxa filosa TaxID=46433 RepID=X6NF15_RETFI|nr:hypothetical protein RFI_12566 [Reticulomyxa filosa]|eukprot:ETO24591.1 hypothetical protein RFI_12566 [Reticulomyxa filosa]